MFQSFTRISAVAALAALSLFAVDSPAAFAQTGVTKTEATQGYFDASSGSRTFEVSAADMSFGTVVNSVEIAIDFEKFDGETFGVNGGATPFYDEIFFSLTNPGGITTTLIAGGSFNVGAGGFRGVINFSDLAASVVNVNPDQPSAGTFRPTGPGSMSTLNGLSGVGTWTLAIQDTTGGDHLGYYSSTLNINGGAVTVPEAGTLALVLPALAMVGAVIVRRRKSA